MSEQKHQPPGLNSGQLTKLEEHVRRGQLLAPEHLLQAAYAHLEDIQSAQAEHPEADVELAQAICEVFARVVAEWSHFSPAQQSCLRGAIGYFIKMNDEQPDTQGEGLQDDRDVVNACLRFAGCEQWVIS